MSRLKLLDSLKLHFATAKLPRGGGPFEFETLYYTCVISFRDIVFAEIEEVTRSSTSVRVGHFSVSRAYRGCDIGEQCLRKFAARVATLDSSIQAIEFELYRLPAELDHQAIGQARADLLTQIGADNVVISPAGPSTNPRVKVTGVWLRNRW